jgi:hypothetical protein
MVTNLALVCQQQRPVVAVGGQYWAMQVARAEHGGILALSRLVVRE